MQLAILLIVLAILVLLIVLSVMILGGRTMKTLLGDDLRLPLPDDPVD